MSVIRIRNNFLCYESLILFLGTGDLTSTFKLEISPAVTPPSLPGKLAVQPVFQPGDRVK